MNPLAEEEASQEQDEIIRKLEEENILLKNTLIKKNEDLRQKDEKVREMSQQLMKRPCPCWCCNAL